MHQAPALNLAFDLTDFPSQVRLVRAAPLPDDLVLLLRIAAGDEEAIRGAIGVSGRSCQAVRDAAGFFIEQILLFPEADSYRVLGSRPEAANGELRRNMALLLRWLHPDLDRHGERSVFITRVTHAWNDLKTPERRATYNQVMRKAREERSRFRKKRNPRSQEMESGHRHHGGMGPYRRPVYFYPDHPGLLRRLFSSLFGRTVY